jgi:UDP-N-acetylmuramate--alanine ligase
MTRGTSSSGPRPYAGRKIHFIGVGGCGMRGLAEFVLHEGGEVSGSDMKDGEATEELRGLGARIFIGHAASNLPPGADLVVASAAVKAENPEMAEARCRGVAIQKYAAFLGGLMTIRKGIAVSGAHGKSTTTAMVSWALVQAGLDPSFVIGAEVPQLGGGARVGRGPHLVVEACEYDRSFLNYKAHAAAILNIEEDHLDYYSGLPEICEAFGDFAAGIAPEGLVVVNGADRNAVEAAHRTKARVVTFGIEGQWDWRAEHLESAQGRFAFDVYRFGEFVTQVRMRHLAGLHHVFNALAAMALCDWAGAPPAAVAEALGAFEGAERRMQLLGEAGGVKVIDDYAHHPTEIQATLKAARARYEPRRLWVVFQPHQHSRTRFLLKDFARALTMADRIVVPDIYFVRDSEKERQAISASDLVSEVQALGASALYIPDFDSIQRYLVESLEPGDVLMTMGAGDVYRLAEPVMAGLGGRTKHSDKPAVPNVYPSPARRRNCYVRPCRRRAGRVAWSSPRLLAG